MHYRESLLSSLAHRDRTIRIGGLLDAQSNDRVNRGGPARGKNTREQGADRKRNDGSAENSWIPSFDLIQVGRDQTGAADRSRNSNQQSDENLQERSSQDQANHAASICTHGNADTDFIGAAFDAVGCYSVQAHRG